MSSETARKQLEAKETMELLFEMSQLLNCGLDRKSLEICVAMLENGVNPEALAAVVKEIKRESGGITDQFVHYNHINIDTY